jgi:hypothetical protein
MALCAPADHNFVEGGEGEGDEWDKYFICTKCGTIAMVPVIASSGATLIAPEKPKSDDSA